MDVNTEEGLAQLEQYLQLLRDNPSYASAILRPKDERKAAEMTQAAEVTAAPRPIGPLGYAYSKEDSPNKNTKVQF